MSEIFGTKHIGPGSVSGRLSAPPSKSMMLRAIAAAHLAKGETLIENASFCDDALAAIGMVEVLGASTAKEDRSLRVISGKKPTGTILNCGESGLAIRLFSAIAALYDRDLTLKAEGSLRNRPVEMTLAPLRQLGASCDADGTLPPLTIKGPITGGTIDVDTSETSQSLTGLLMALPVCARPSRINVHILKSAPYVTMTLSLLKDFGIEIFSGPDYSYFEIPGGQAYRSGNYHVEGDWSGAAFPLVAAALTGEIELMDIDVNADQADRAVLEALRKAGAHVRISDDSVHVARRKLAAFQFDATDCPDLFPPLAALALGCEGNTVIKGATRLRYKESDRATALLTELKKLGATLHLEDDLMTIVGRRPTGGTGDSHGDHRIAMALATAGLISENGVRIEGWPCVAKSYPHFFSDLEKLTGNEG